MLKENYCSFQATVNVTNINEYGKNPNAYLLNVLSKIYNQRNRMNEHILKVVQILERGQCVINKTNISSIGVVSVLFIAKVLNVSVGDMLPNVSIIANNICYIGSYDYVYVEPGTSRTSTTKILSSIESIPGKEFKIGWTIPFVITEIEKTPETNSVSVFGNLVSARYYLENKFVWKIDKENAKLEIDDIITQKIKEIKVELTLRDEVNCTFFEKLFYPKKIASAAASKMPTKWQTYEGGPMWQGPPALNVTGALTSLVGMVDAAINGKEQNFEGIWTRPLELHRSSPMIQKLSGEDASAVDTCANVMVMTALSEILEALQLVRKMSVMYDEEKISSQATLWTIIEDLKL